MPLRARDNPFATHSILRIRYRLAQAEWDRLLDRLESLGGRGAIVGPEGSGKTTLLEDLGTRLSEKGFTFRLIHAGRLDADPLLKTVGTPHEREFILVDSAELLGRFRWRVLRLRSRKAAGMVVTTHRPGSLPTLFECLPSIETLEEIINELLGRSPYSTQWIGALFDRHNGNIRTALRELYDLCALGGPSSG